MSHELRTPLALVLGPAERVLADLGPDDPHRRQLEVILRNARVLLGHVNDLLDTSKIEAAMLELDYTELDLSHLVRLVANNFETLALDRSVDFFVLAPDDAVPVQVDPARVQQVLLNLLSNVFKFTPPHGTVRIELKGVTERGTARVEVGDSGPGIPAERRDEVFERFHQLDGAATRKMGGTGLGLHIAREVTGLHGGTLAIDDAPEGGALFVVELPVVAPPGTTVRTDGVTVPEDAAATLLDGYGVPPRAGTADAEPHRRRRARRGAPCPRGRGQPRHEPLRLRRAGGVVPGAIRLRRQAGVRTRPGPAARPDRLRLHDARDERHRPGARRPGRATDRGHADPDPDGPQRLGGPDRRPP